MFIPKSPQRLEFSPPWVLLGPPGDPFWPPWGYLGTPWSPLSPALAPLGANFGDLGPPRPLPERIFIKFHQISSEIHREIIKFLIGLLQICYPLPSPISPIPFPLQALQYPIPSNPPGIQASKMGLAECAKRLNK